MPSSHLVNESRRFMEAIDWFAFANQATIPPPRRRSRYGVNRQFVAHGRYEVRGYQVREPAEASGSDVELISRPHSVMAHLNRKPISQEFDQSSLFFFREATGVQHQPSRRVSTPDHHHP